MKKVRFFFAALLSFCCMGYALHAQQRVVSLPPHDYRPYGYQNEFSFSPLYIFANTFAMGYQRNFSHGALFLQPSVAMMRSDKHDDTPFRGTGLSLEAQYKLYFMRNPSTVNIYIGPYSLVRTYHVVGDGYYWLHHEYKQYSHIDERVNVWGMGVVFGVHFMFGRFTMDVQTGGGVRVPGNYNQDVFDGRSIFAPAHRGIVPKFNFTLGVAF